MEERNMLKLMESLPGAVYQATGASEFSYCTDSLEKLLFVSPNELAMDGSLAWRYVCPEFIDPVRKAYERSAESLSELDITFRIRSPQGRFIWVRNRATPERQADDGTVWYGWMEDVTTKVDADDAVKRKNALRRELFDHLPDYIYYKDCKGRILGANPACCHYLGKTEAELFGKTDVELYPGEHGKKNFAKEQRLMADGVVHEVREKLIREDGRVVYLDTVKCPLFSQSGRLLGLAGISRDVTSLVESEKSLIRSKQDAEQSAAFIQALFDNLDDQLYYKDRQARIIGGNKAWLKARHVDSLDDLVGKTDLDIHPAPLGQELFDKEQELIASGEVAHMRERHELEDGTVHYLGSVKCPMRNEAGEIIGLAGISRDITEQVENEQVLIEARQASDAANQAKSMFLAMMSHEIRTPMNGIIGASSLLEGTDLAPLQKEFVRTINVSGESLLTLINDILDYSKIEAGKIKLEQIPFSLRTCIEDCFDLFARSAGKKNLELIHYVDPAIAPVLEGDPTRLRQVIINLVGNAVKFTEKGEISLKVMPVEGDAKDGSCTMRFSIHDTGVGIAEEAQQHLFQAFTQADSSSTRKYGGTGLGLSISRRLVELMGGTISLESILGEGSSFFFELALPVTTEILADSIGNAQAANLSGMRALIVDDNETNRWLLTDQLKRWNMNSRAFEFPEEALTHLQEGYEYDIALIDYQMPVMDGRELAEAMQNLSPEKQIPVIILSSSYESFPEDPAVHAWLSKPVKQDRLREQLARVLSGSGIPQKPADQPTEITVQARKHFDLRILVAEDNAINQRIIKMMLNRLGYDNAVVVPDGEDAVAAAIDAEYDVILMDVQMPVMNGLDATRQIRKHSGRPDKPWILALSAGVMEEEQNATVEAGMNGFLAKPLAVNLLKEALDKLRASVMHSS